MSFLNSFRFEKLPFEVLVIKSERINLTKSAGEGKPVKRTARMFDDRATPRSPFVVAYSPRSHPDTITSLAVRRVVRLQFSLRHHLIGEQIYQKSKLNINTYGTTQLMPC